jgi:hypothetical protein
MNKFIIYFVIGFGAAQAHADPLPFPVPVPGGGSNEYNRGYRDGFRDGYNQAMQEGSRGHSRPPGGNPYPGNIPQGRTDINIVSAVYGDYSRDCDATRFLSWQASGKPYVNVEVTNQMCGDPSPGNRKTLRVRYYCGNDIREASATEHRNIILDCTAVR